MADKCNVGRFLKHALKEPINIMSSDVTFLQHCYSMYVFIVFDLYDIILRILFV